MDSKEVIYHVNGRAIGLGRRIASSKTFWVVAAFVLAAADRWNKGEISGTDFFQMTQVGIIGILIRAAMAKSELAANAANPNIATIAARPSTSRIPAEVKGLAACIITAGALVTLAACSGKTPCLA